MAEKPFPDMLQTVWQVTRALWAIVDLTHAGDEATKALPQTFGTLIRFLAPVLEEAYCDRAEASTRCPCGAMRDGSGPGRLRESEHRPPSSTLGAGMVLAPHHHTHERTLLWTSGSSSCCSPPRAPRAETARAMRATRNAPPPLRRGATAS